MKGLESAVDTQTASPAAVVRVSCNQRVRSAGDNSLELQLVGDVVSFDANVEVLGGRPNQVCASDVVHRIANARASCSCQRVDCGNRELVVREVEV